MKIIAILRGHPQHFALHLRTRDVTHGPENTEICRINQGYTAQSLYLGYMINRASFDASMIITSSYEYKVLSADHSEQEGRGSTRGGVRHIAGSYAPTYWRAFLSCSHPNLSDLRLSVADWKSEGVDTAVTAPHT